MPFLNDMLDDIEKKKVVREALNVETTLDIDVSKVHKSSNKKLNSRYKFDIPLIMEMVESEIIGQQQAVKSINDMLEIVRADITDPRKPLYISLLLGPTGVGKTEIVRVLAKALYGDSDEFCRIDMNTLSQSHYAASLTGAPPGYVGSKEGTTIIDEDKIEGKAGIPGIILFDELEKASAEVLQALLNVFDNGLLTVASGEKTYNFRNSIIFMTSNLAANEIQQYEEGQKTFLRKILPRSQDKRNKYVSKIVNKKMIEVFSPEFVNRIDNIIIFNWIEEETVHKIIELEIKKLNKRLIKHKICIELDCDVINYIVSDGFDKQFGARSLKRAVRKNIELSIAEHLINSNNYNEYGEIESYQAILKNKIITFIKR